ncbi:MAG: hypothetical protein V2A70_01500 [Candidatus Omnitrophota bacterium]
MMAKSKLCVFLSLSAIITSLYIFLVVQHRLPIAHDTGQYLQFQYIYFNEIAQHHSFPHWFPFVQQGYVGNHYASPQYMILSPISYLLAFLGKGVNYLYVFYAGVWFDEIFFMIGLLLLGSVFYQRRATLFFVGLTAFGSTIWYPQIFWGMHLFYFIPMVLFCFHQFLNEKNIYYLIGAFLVFWLGFIGNALYINVFVAFVLLVYGAALFLFSNAARGAWWDAWAKIKMVHVLALVSLGVLIGLSLYYAKFADDQIISFVPGRTAGNRVSLDVFLQYGGAIDIRKYLSFFNRAEARFLTADVQLYSGFAMAFLAIIGLFFSRVKMRWPIAVTALIMVLFSSATFISQIFYYCFPFGFVCRHIGLTATVTKLFVILLAGFGADVVFTCLKNDKYRQGIFWGGLFFLFVFLCRGFNVSESDPFLLLGIKERHVLDMLRYILLAGVLGVGVAGWRGLKYRYKALVVIFLAVVTLELFTYKYAKTVDTMPRVSTEALGLFKPVDYAFPMLRTLTTMEHAKDSERMKTFWPLLQEEERLGRLWSVYNTMETFFFVDTLQSNFRSDYALVPVKSFFTAALAAPPQVQEKVYLQQAGVLANKVGVFSQLNYAADDKELAQIFNGLVYKANSLWTTADQVKKIVDLKARLFVFEKPESTGGNVPAKIEVKKFSFNEIVMDVDVQGEQGRPYFLYYASAYHPFWKVRVDGRDQAVLKVNMAYKAVVIPSGHCEVVFYFSHIFYYISVVCSLLLCVGILVLVVYLTAFLVRVDE